MTSQRSIILEYIRRKWVLLDNNRKSKSVYKLFLLVSLLLLGFGLSQSAVARAQDAVTNIGYEFGDLPQNMHTAMTEAIQSRPSGILDGGTYFIVGHYESDGVWGIGHLAAAVGSEPPAWENSVWFIVYDKDTRRVALQGTPLFNEFMIDLPLSLNGQIALRIQKNVASVQTTTFLFPWDKSQQWRYTFGWHGNTGLALDFAPTNVTPGNMWVLASASGTVTLVCSDSYQAAINLSTPGGVMTYRHIDYNSLIAQNVNGQAVTQGKKLAILYNGTVGGGYYDISTYPYPACVPGPGSSSSCIHIQFNTYCGSGSGAHVHWTLPAKPFTVDGWQVDINGLWTKSGQPNKTIGALFTSTNHASDIYEVDDVLAQAKTITSGTPQTHSIFPATDVDWVKFQVNSLSAMLLETSGPDLASNTRLSLYDSGSNPIETDDDSGLGFFSFIDRVCGVDSLAAGTYYVKVENFSGNPEISAYDLSFNSSPCPSASIDVSITGERQGSYLLLPSGSTRSSLTGLNAGPVKVESINGVPIITAERVLYKVNGVDTSYSEMIGLPDSQLNTTYWLPWYNNVTLDTQLRLGNVSGSLATVHVFIGGAEMVGSPFSLTASGVGQSTRVSFAGVNNGSLKVISDVAIVASERVLYKVNGVDTSYSEMLGLPNGQLDTTYWMPWYNNVTLDTQLRLGNVSGALATVHVFVGGAEMVGSPFSLTATGAGQSTRVSFAGVNNGPLKVVSDVAIVASERVLYKVNGVDTSYSEMIGLPNSQLNTTHWMPWYNNITLDTQLRLGNVSGALATVHVFVGGAEMVGSPFSLTASGAGQSTRVSFAGVNNGPLQVVSDVAIVASERVLYKVNGVDTSYSEMIGLPNSQLSTTYWMPWYNNVTLDTQLRFAAP